MITPPSREATAPGPVRTPIDWLHVVVVLVAFSITGSVSVVFSQFLLKDVMNLEGGVWSGPWSYRIFYLLLIPPSYSVTLVVVGTLLGKRSYFANRVLSTWGRLLPRRLFRRPDSQEKL